MLRPTKVLPQRCSTAIRLSYSTLRLQGDLRSESRPILQPEGDGALVGTFRADSYLRLDERSVVTAGACLRTGTHGQRSLELHSRLPSAAPLRPGRFGGRRPFDRRVRLSRRIRAPRRADQLRDRHRLPSPPRIPTGRSPSPQHRQRSDGHDRRRILDGSIPHRPDCARTHLQTVAGGRILRRTGRQYRRIPHDGTGQLFRTLRRRRRPVPLLQRQGIRAFADSSPEPHLRLVGPPAIRAFLQPQHFQRTQLRPGRPTRDANPVGQRRTPLRAGRFRSGGLLRIEAGIRKRRRQRRDGGLPDIGRVRNVPQPHAATRCRGDGDLESPADGLYARTVGRVLSARRPIIPTRSGKSPCRRPAPAATCI